MREEFSVLDRLPLGCFVISRSYAVLHWNLCMEGWTDLPASEALGSDLRELFPKFRESAVSTRLEALFDGGPPVILSFQLHGDLLPRRRPTRVPRVRQCTASSLPSADGLVFVVEDCTDIAAKSRDARAELERREAVEGRLRAALEEGEMLMREMHHRVKNNLHMVQSLISLETSSLPEGSAKDWLAALEARVNSIAELHDSLSHQKPGSEIAADEYLASICEHIFSALAATPGGPSLRLELEELSLPSDQILYLGLAVNELITNAVKYGGKRITLSLARAPGGGIEVCVKDDGPGFETLKPPRADSLGLRLVESLTGQMGGSLEADGSSGGLFRMRIPAPVQ